MNITANQIREALNSLHTIDYYLLFEWRAHPDTVILLDGHEPFRTLFNYEVKDLDVPERIYGYPVIRDESIPIDEIRFGVQVTIREEK